MATRAPALPPNFKEHPARAELRAIYDEVDALLAPFSCEGTRECCHFGITGREPYPTAVEMAEVEEAVRSAGISLAPSAPRHVASSRGTRERRALPVLDEGRASGERGSADARRCPLLSTEGRCRIYASRPFGCRTYFCDRVTGPAKLPRKEILRASSEVAALSSRFAPRDPLPRPLVRALAASRATGR
jgi:Fe-S-cluster containining protein